MQPMLCAQGTRRSLVRPNQVVHRGDIDRTHAALAQQVERVLAVDDRDVLEPLARAAVVEEEGRIAAFEPASPTRSTLS